ncbi:MAG: hypothetical protein ACD_2C00209G0001 [uncultured bacterium (gcode 4)]|uniref:Uncharacterized protein n=1 Tax=uncultured bacterium (gcode 4) TaxID=1234023 RepID=K2G4E6_9BACT|nr:MAG: hypothetical protein ACD_2C00209G0001 [uncultured bacterium (gcode 4)]
MNQKNLPFWREDFFILIKAYWMFRYQELIAGFMPCLLRRYKSRKLYFMPIRLLPHYWALLQLGGFVRMKLIIGQNYS